MTLTKKEMQMLTEIATSTIPELENRKDLEQHMSDEEDFFETSVWSLEDALKKAFELGRKSR